jgi:hypothetical protein
METVFGDGRVIFSSSSVSNVGITMGGLGSDATIRATDVVVKTINQ